MSRANVRALAWLGCLALPLWGCDEISSLTDDGGLGGFVGGEGGGPMGGQPAGGEPVGGDPAGGAGGEPVGGEPAGGAGGEPVGGEPVGGGGSECPIAEAAPDDAPRVILIGHPFTEEPGVDGTDIRALIVSDGAMPEDTGIRLDVGTRVARIVFAPSGEVALVLGEDGRLVSVQVSPDGALEIIDSIELPGGSYADLHLSEDATVAWAVNGNNQAEGSGIATVAVGCDGTLEHQPEDFFDVVLSNSMVLVPDSDLAILQGGQAIFEPFVDERDLRLLTRDGLGWRELDAFDIYGDFITHSRMAISPDGETLLVPNSSPISEEGHQVAVVSFDGSSLALEARRTELTDASEALFSLDGSTALVTLVEPGHVVVFGEGGDGLMTEVDRITGVGLANQMARIARGPHADTIYLASVDPNGTTNVTVLRIDGTGDVSDLGELDLGGGSLNIPRAIGILP